MLAPLENRRERNRQEDERSADEIEDDVWTNVAQRDGMARRLVTHRLAPAVPNVTVMLICNKPESKPSECEPCKNSDRSRHQQNLTALKFPAEKKRRQHEPKLSLLHATQMNNQRRREDQH